MNTYFLVLLMTLEWIGSPQQKVNNFPSANPAVECLEYSVVFLDADGLRQLQPGDLVYGDCTGCTVDVVGDEFEDIVDCRLAGKRVDVMIHRPGMPQPIFCRTTVLDNMAPIFTACDDITVGCHLDLETSPPDSFGIEVEDACGIDSLYPIICGAEPGDCEEVFKTLKVQWQAVDVNGNISNCTQYVSFEKALLADVTFSLSDTMYCEDPNIEGVGAPLLHDSIPINPLCGLSVNCKIIQESDVCGAQKWIMKEWTVLDLCTFETETVIQSIAVLDTTPPLIPCPENDTLFTDASRCEVDYTLPRLDTLIEHNCEGDGTGQTTFIVNDKFYTPGFTIQLDTGTHEIKFIAADLCWNMDTCIYLITVRDTSGPILVFCPPDTVILQTLPDYSCEMLPDTLGEPEFFEPCCGVDTVFCMVIDSSASTTSPRLIRKWVAMDSCGLFSDTCSQIIRIMEISRAQTPMIHHRSIWSVANEDGPAETRSLRSSPMIDSIELIKVRPNPWSDFVFLEFFSSGLGRANLIISDIQGRFIAEKDISVTLGKNQVMLNSYDIAGGSGLYLVRIKLADRHLLVRMLHTQH